MQNLHRTNSVQADWLALVAPCATVFFSSACIMVLELVAGRLVSRHLGQSLYTWTSIISVVLAGIAVGNYAGGRLADRRWDRLTLGMQFLAAAAGCLVIFPINAVAGTWPLLVSLSWPVRIFLHVSLVFFFPSAVLGTISPVIVKRALQLGYAPGKTVGDIYAWATAGSIVGTFFTGFYLLMMVGASTAAMGAAVGLAILSGVFFIGGVMERKEKVVAVLAAVETPVPVWGKQKRLLWGPVATVFVANAGMMATEVVAGRMMSRYYGQSLYTWTTVIGVILMGLTVGSYVGGQLSSRYANRLYVGMLLLGAAVFNLFIPLMGQYAVGWFGTVFSLPLRLQLALMGMALFFIPSSFIGAVSPIVAKVALEQQAEAGRTVGAIYAWGSLGSIVGTLLTGFYLIALAGTLLTLYTVSFVLGLAAVLHGRHKGLAYGWVGAGGCVVAMMVIPVEPLTVFRDPLAWAKFADSPTVYAGESQYSCIHVVADPANNRVRELILDRLIHSKIDLDDPVALKYEYEWVYSAVVDRFYTQGTPVKSLIIGGGGYTFPRFLELTRPGSHVEVAEIDPAVTKAAHVAFGLPENTAIEIHHMDARNRIADLGRLKTAQMSYDLIFGDSVNDYSVPYHLTTQEFNEAIKGLLKDDGLYLLNMIDSFESGRFLAAVVNTCRKTFPYVYVFSRYADPSLRDTFVVVNAKRPLNMKGVVDQIRSVHVGFEGQWIADEKLDALIFRNGGLVLTDDFAPVENLLAPMLN